MNNSSISEIPELLQENSLQKKKLFLSEEKNPQNLKSLLDNI